MTELDGTELIAIGFPINIFLFIRVSSHLVCEITVSQVKPFIRQVIIRAVKS